MVQVLGHRDQVVLDVGEVEALRVRVSAGGEGAGTEAAAGGRTHDVRRGRDLPVLVASLREPLDDVCLVAHEAQEPHDLLSTRPNAVHRVNGSHSTRSAKGGATHRLSMSLCSASLRMSTSSSMLSTSYSMLWMSGPNASVMSSMSAYEIQSEVTLM